MTALTKIAILVNKDSNLTFELEEADNAFRKLGIEMHIFFDSDHIMSYKPDCVIVTSPQDAKLTPYPTYGLINRPKDEYLETPRFLRNILTYDGYFTRSPRLKQMLRDVMFGARKLGSSIESLDFFPVATEFKQPNLEQQKILIFEPDFAHSRAKKAILHLLATLDNVFVASCSQLSTNNKYANRFIVVNNFAELGDVIHNYGIAICLNSGDQQEKLISPTLIKIISSSAITITHHTESLESYFGDNLYYIPASTSLKLLPKVIKDRLQQINNNPAIAIQKCKAAHQIFLESFALDKLLQNFIQFHQRTLINKGYVPNKDPEIEKSLPSVSYIMRTGGKHRPFLERALDCLVAQQYPDLHVIFVLHAPVPYIDEIIKKYSSLKIKVIESIKSRRSEAIRDGIAAVETELFGLFDDDDELSPNHIRSLVKTLNYHTNLDWRGEIGMVYSGSIHADDTYEVAERQEYRDHRLEIKHEKRALEHFKFYSSLLMSKHAWFMPNGWLARSKLIAAELLDDPELDTCEDLYFELQIAQKAHFAFSVEVTAVHNFHHLGNSTIDDSHKHLPDTQRIALRNFSRVFPPDALYDTYYSLIGKLSQHDPNQIAYNQHISKHVDIEYFYNHPFYPFRNRFESNLSALVGRPVIKSKLALILLIICAPFMGLMYLVMFITIDKGRRNVYRHKLRISIQHYGFIRTFIRMYYYARYFIMQKILASKYYKLLDRKNFFTLYYYKIKIAVRYLGWVEFIKLSFKNRFAKRL